jgi:hypothetical protein
MERIRRALFFVLVWIGWLVLLPMVLVGIGAQVG